MKKGELKNVQNQIISANTHIVKRTYRILNSFLISAYSIKNHDFVEIIL